MARNAGAVNRYLASRIRGEPDILYEAASHLVRSGGKRLRPFLVSRCCQILGGAPRGAMFAAGAVEMIHNFTLIHDDIMDNDETRHGVQTTHRKYGEALSILAGDVLFSKAFQTAASSLSPPSGPGAIPPGRALELLQRLSTACVEVCEGQVMDIRMAGGRGIPTRAQYVRMVGKKTAALFDVSCAAGAICANGRPGDVASLSSFGRNLGIAFQITDDLIGVMGDPGITKKPVGNDLREGKKSLPIVAAIGRARGGDRRAIMRCFGNPKAGRGDLRRAVDAIRGLGIEESVRGQALRYADRAARSLSGYGGSARDDLSSLLDFVVKRAV